MSNNVIRCLTCGESNSKYFVHNNEKIICDRCGTIVNIEDSEEKSILLEAQNALSLYDFEKADELYKKLLKDTENDNIKASCYFGRLLVFFGVVFIKDFNNNQIITFTDFDPDFISIKDSSFYKDLQKCVCAQEYNDVVERIDAEYNKLFDLYNNGKNINYYDAFICTKISQKTHDHPDAQGYTEESKIAESLKENLRKIGINAFYSDVDLKGIQYDAQILTALMKSRTLIVISTCKEYLESPWVQSEWRRWINLIDKGVKKPKSLYLLIPNGVKFELPYILRKCQIFQDSSKIVNEIVKSTEIDNSENNYSKDYIIGKKLYDEKDYTSAVKHLKIAHNNEDFNATFLLGECYFNGYGISENKEKAVEYFNLAKEKGILEAKERLAECYYNGDGIEQDYEISLEYYKELANDGDIKARYKVGFIYETCSNMEEALKWYQKAARASNKDAIKRLERLLGLNYSKIKKIKNIYESYTKITENRKKLEQKSERNERYKSIAIGILFPILLTILLTALQGIILYLSELLGITWHLIIIEPVFILLMLGLFALFDIDSLLTPSFLIPCLLLTLGATTVYYFYFSSMNLVLFILLLVIILFIFIFNFVTNNSLTDHDEVDGDRWLLYLVLTLLAGYSVYVTEFGMYICSLGKWHMLWFVVSEILILCALEGCIVSSDFNTIGVYGIIGGLIFGFVFDIIIICMVGFNIWLLLLTILLNLGGALIVVGIGSESF